MRSLIRSLIIRFDKYMCRKMNVIEFWDNPNCLIRVRLAQSDRALVVANEVIPVGEKIIEIHFWNEHIPPIPATGSDMKRAIKLVRMLMSTFTELAHQIDSDERFQGVKAVGGITPLFFAGEDSSGERIWKRLGFTMTPFKHPLGWFGEFWENVYTLMIMWAFNPLSERNQRLLSMRRTEFWTTTDEFIKIHFK